jgi:hypothetical protein
MSSSKEYVAYYLKHQKDFIKLTDKQELELARLYIQAAGDIKARAKDIIGNKSLTAAQAKIRINSLLREAARLSDNFEKLLDKSIIESVDLSKEVNKIIMSDYQKALKEAGYDLKLTRILNRVNSEAIKAVYNRIWTDGLKLSDRIWLLDRRTKQEIERIVMQHVISGGAASDRVTISALENLLNPAYTPAKLTSLHGRKVGYEASRLLRTTVAEAFNEGDRLSNNVNPGITDTLILTAPGACTEICAPKEGKSVKDEGYPTYHPSCRCTTRSEVLSPESFADKWVDFMHGGNQPRLAKWYNEIYLGKAA